MSNEVNSQVVTKYINDLEMENKNLKEIIKRLQTKTIEYERIVNPPYPAYPQSLEYWWRAYGQLRKNFEKVISEEVSVQDLIKKGQVIKFNGKFSVNFE